MDNMIIIMGLVIFVLFICVGFFYSLLVKTMEKSQAEHKILVDQISQLTEKLMARNYAEYSQGQRLIAQEKQKQSGPSLEDIAAETEYLKKLNDMMGMQPI